MKNPKKWLACLIILALMTIWTEITTQAQTPSLQIFAVYYDTQISGQFSEAVALINAGTTTIDLQGWQLGSDGNRLTFPNSQLIESGHIIWVARRAYPFHNEFGFLPNYEHPSTGSDNNPAVPDLNGSGFELTNTGDEVYLNNPSQQTVDALVFESAGDPTDLPSGTHWLGSPLQPYSPNSSFSEKGQVLYRRLDFSTHPLRPVTDTNQAADWAAFRSSAADNPVNGRKVSYRGSALFDPAHYPDSWFDTLQNTTDIAYTELLIAPDNIYAGLIPHIRAAQHSILVNGLEFTSAELAIELAARSKAGVTVRILVDGSPAGGIDPTQNWACRHLETGQYGLTPPADTSLYTGECWLFKSLSTLSGAQPRYNTLHAKYMLLDPGTPTAKVVISSENWKTYSLPADEKSNGTSGNRGVALVTNAASVVERVWQLWQNDFQPCTRWQGSYCIQGHHDLQRWQDPGDITPWPYLTFDNTAYPVKFPTPLILPAARYAVEVIHAPENALNSHSGLLAMVARAGAGDTVLIEQLYEYAYWGASSSNAEADPNPRLQAYQAAAQRGAKVRILLNRILVGTPPAPPPPDPRDNDATCLALNSWAANNRLDLQCLVGRVTGDDIHNKMVLVQTAGQGYLHIGSLNGSENSNKNNRELVIQLQSTAGYQYLAQMFMTDWFQLGGRGLYNSYLPVIQP